MRGVLEHRKSVDTSTLDFRDEIFEEVSSKQSTAKAAKQQAAHGFFL